MDGTQSSSKCFTGLVGVGMFVTPIQMVALRQRSIHTV